MGQNGGNHNAKQEKDVFKGCESNPELCAKIDPSGTDPNRYETVSQSQVEHNDDNYSKDPKNHTTPSERMLNPDRGN